MERNKEYWELINKAVYLINDTLELEDDSNRWGINNTQHIQANYELIDDVYNKLYDMGFSKQEIDMDVYNT